jgi:cytochrome P450
MVQFDLTGQAFKRDPFPTLSMMRAAGPVVTTRVPLIGRTAFVTTYAAVEKLLKSPDHFSVDLGRARRTQITTLIRWLPGLRHLADNMLQKDDPEHRKLRKLVDSAFRRDEIETWVPRIERIADQLIDDLFASEERDLVKHVSRSLPLAVICELLGLPRDDRPKFIRWMASISELDSVWGLARLLPAIRNINRYLVAKFAERRKEPRADLISALVHARDDGDQLSDNELLAMCFLLFVAGHETTTHLISGGVLALLQNCDQLDRLRYEPDLTPSAVEELLRFVSPVQMTKPRFPVEDLEIEGITVRKGQTLMALLASANADPKAFDDPETLDLGRENNRHLAFGGGPHFCLGAWLARTEMEVLLRRLVERAPALAIAVPENELLWTERIGIRALKTLPLKL